ncbi:MAG: hypothetical protein K6G52_01420 [Treponemataceae bacterium]|nr:hypothetical protein [Treponemataceae bacterium]
MKNKSVELSILGAYELIKAIIILKMSAVSTNAISIPAASWFYGVPLLILPFIIILGTLFNNEKFASCMFLIPIFKILSAVSFAGYTAANVKTSIFELKSGNYLPCANLIFLMLFLIIDVIIGVVIYIKEGRKCK